MSLKGDLYTYLINVAGVSALVEDRVYPSFVGSMAAALPYACYDISSTQAEQHLAGVQDLAQASVAIQCWAVDAPGSDALALQVRLALDGYRGTMGTTDVRRIFYDSETDSIAVPDDGGSLPTYLRTISFRIWHRVAELTPN
jgi:hypothetical protein